MLLVNKKFNCIDLSIKNQDNYNTLKGEHVMVKIVQKTKIWELSMIFGTVYCPNISSSHNSDLSNLNDLLIHLNDSHRCTFCIAGDFNAWHTTWSCSSTRKQGSILKNIIRERKNVFIYPKDYTRHGISSINNEHVYSTLDMFITTKFKTITSCKTCIGYQQCWQPLF